jgi:hypothetical protein
MRDPDPVERSTGPARITVPEGLARDSRLWPGFCTVLMRLKQLWGGS